MIPKLATEKAIEGGWQTDLEALKQNPSKDYYWQKISLDPLFWQALGKSLGWEEGKGKNHDPVWRVAYNIEEALITEPWLNFALQFQFLILQGQPTDTFWQELLSDSQ